MKVFHCLFASMFSLLGLNAVLASTTFAPIERVFVVDGFDTNDNVEIVLKGRLPDLCHKAPKLIWKAVADKVFIDAILMKQEGAVCPQVVVPFLETVALGTLPKGEYDIIVNAGTDLVKRNHLTVEEAPANAVDSFIYANINHIETKAGSNLIRLNGYNPSDCLELKEFKITDNSFNAFAILPIMEQVRDHCPMKMVQFSYEIEIPRLANQKEVLLHVRSMSGKSVNRLFRYPLD